MHKKVLTICWGVCLIAKKVGEKERLNESGFSQSTFTCGGGNKIRTASILPSSTSYNTRHNTAQ